MSDSDAEFESADEGDEVKHAGRPSQRVDKVDIATAVASSKEHHTKEDKHSAECDMANAEDEASKKAEPSSEVSDVDVESEVPQSSDVDVESEVQQSSDRTTKPDAKNEDSKSSLSEGISEDGANIASLFDKFSIVGGGDDRSSEDAGSSWGWSSWGTSIMSKAANSVSTLTSQFGEGIQVLGIPDPQELAQQQREEEKQLQDQPLDDSSQSTLISHLVSISSIFEKTGSTVLTTGLDTLELIGKKTMDVLQEGDPGLKNKIAFFRESKPNLSEVLREAQSKSQIDIIDNKEVKKINYSVLFDECQGLIHLEALEMLSKEHEEQLSVLLKQDRYDDEVMGHVREIGELCNLEDFDESLDDLENFSFLDELKETLLIKSDIKISRFQEIHETTMLNFEDFDAEFEAEIPPNPEDPHSAAIRTLADFTAASMEYLHKLSERIVLDETYTDELTNNLCSALKLLCHEVEYISSRYSEYLNKPLKSLGPLGTNETVASFTTEIYHEASNSITYLQNALQLLAPILQLTYVKAQPNVSEH